MTTSKSLDHQENSDQLNPTSREPNFTPPYSDPSFVISYPDGSTANITLSDLRALPKVKMHECFIVSTGHGTSGPFVFSGPLLLDLVEISARHKVEWDLLEIISADGFGVRISNRDLHTPYESEQIILAFERDGLPLTREQGLVRLIVPSEKDDALKQVKWISQIKVVNN